MLNISGPIAIKLSGERFGGEVGRGFNGLAINDIAEELAAFRQTSAFDAHPLIITVGGGNHFRGARSSAEIGIEQNIGDGIGMLGTAINVLALHGNLKRLGVPNRPMSAVPLSMMDFYTSAAAQAALERKEILLCACGTGHAFCTTDYAAALRAAELGAKTLIKFTSVDGVFSADPKKSRRAKWIPKITHQKVISRGLGIMDTAALTLCRDQDITIIVCKMVLPGCLTQLILKPESIQHSVISRTGA